MWLRSDCSDIYGSAEPLLPFSLFLTFILLKLSKLLVRKLRRKSSQIMKAQQMTGWDSHLSEEVLLTHEEEVQILTVVVDEAIIALLHNGVAKSHNELGLEEMGGVSLNPLGMVVVLDTFSLQPTPCLHLFLPISFHQKQISLVPIVSLIDTHICLPRMNFHSWCLLTTSTWFELP